MLPLTLWPQVAGQPNWQAKVDEQRRVLEKAPQNADAHIALGIALWGAGDRRGALNAFQKATQLNPNSAQAHYSAGIALRDIGEPEKALAAMQQAVKLAPTHELARIALGVLLQQKGDVAGAIVHYQLVLKHHPKSAEAHNWLGVALMQKNQLKEAAAELREAIRLQPDLVRAHNNLGSTLAQAGNLPEAIAAFQAGLRYAPSDVALRLNLGTALRTKGDSEAAIRQFEEVLKHNPENHEVHLQIGQTRRQTGDLEGAVRAIDASLALNSEYQEGYYLLGQVLRQMASRIRRPAVPKDAQELNSAGFAQGRSRDLPAAVASLRQAIAIAPHFADAHSNLGAALWYSGDRNGAAREFDEALRLNPAAVDAYGFRAMVFRETGDLKSARWALQRAIALEPKLPLGYFDLAVVLLRMDKPAEALAQFDAGLNLPFVPGTAPDVELAIAELRKTIAGRPSAEAHHTLGRVLGLAGADAQLVIAEFEAATKLQPDYTEALNNLGLVHLQSGDDPKAAAAFREAIRRKPDEAHAHANLGALLTATDPPAAIRELERAITLQPGLLRAQFNLAMAYSAAGNPKEIDVLRKLIAQEPQYPRAAFSLGKALLRKGAAAEAIPHLEKAVQTDGASGEARYQLGLALARAGRTQEAEQQLKSGRDLITASQNEEALAVDMAEGRRALAKGDIDDAIGKFTRVTRTRPELAEAHFQLGLALERKGDKEGAARAWRAALDRNPWHAEAQQNLDRRSGGDDPEQVRAFESYIREGRFQELQPLLEKYLAARPQSSWGWYALGFSFFAQQKVGESINALAKSLSINVRNAEAHKVLGRNLMIIGRLDDAKREFEQGAKYDPQSAEMPYNLGKLHSIKDQWPEAKAAFERALERDVAYMEAYDGLGFALESLGDDAGAITNYEKAAKLNAERKAAFAAPYVNLSALHLKAGNADAALAAARQAVEVSPKSDRGWFQLGKALERKGDFDGAQQALAKAIATNPRVSTYHYVLANVYRRLGKAKESQDEMDTFSRLESEFNQLEQKRREALRQDR